MPRPPQAGKRKAEKIVYLCLTEYLRGLGGCPAVLSGHEYRARSSRSPMREDESSRNFFVSPGDQWFLAKWALTSTLTRLTPFPASTYETFYNCGRLKARTTKYTK